MNPRPHVTVNVAMSADGKIDTVERKGATISSAADKARVDRLRAESDAILVGGRTLLDEDPKLTVKSAQLRQERKTRGLEENPIKIGVVSVADLHPEGNFLKAGPARRLIYTTKRTPNAQIIRLKNAGVQVVVLGEERIDLRSVMRDLHEQGIQHLMVEGGGTLLAELFRMGLVDEIYAYVAARIFGGASSPTLADGPGFLQKQAPRLRLASVEKFDEEGGILIHYLVQPNRDTETSKR